MYKAPIGNSQFQQPSSAYEFEDDAGLETRDLRHTCGDLEATAKYARHDEDSLLSRNTLK